MYCKLIHSAPKKIETGKYMYLDRPQITAPATERSVADSHSKLLFAATGPFLVIEITPATVPIDEGGIQNSVSVVWATGAPTAKKTLAQDNGTQTDEKEAEGEYTFALSM